VTWATSVPIFVFLCLSVLDLGPMYATDRRQTDVRQKHRLMPPPVRGGGIIKTKAVKVTETGARDSGFAVTLSAKGQRSSDVV